MTTRDEDGEPMLAENWNAGLRLLACVECGRECWMAPHRFRCEKCILAQQDDAPKGRP